MPGGRYDVLFFCAGNAARSLLAECILNRLSGGKFRAHSAGSQPEGEVHPMALDLLRRFGHVTDGLRSKSWDAFAPSGAPDLDFVFTVCDNAAGEVCPIWPGQPMTAHWDIEDPAAVTASEDKQRQAFRNAYFQLERRIRIFSNLPMTSLNRLALQSRLDAIGTAQDDQGSAA